MRAVEMMHAHGKRSVPALKQVPWRAPVRAALLAPLLAALLGGPAPAAAGELPAGFGALRWQAPVSQLADARKVAETPLYACYRSGEGYGEVAGTAVSNLRQCFADDRFYFVQMEFAGNAAFDAMLAYGKANWGEGRTAQRFTEAHIWGGGVDEQVYVELEYSREDNRGTLAFVFLPIYRETQEASRRQRARATPGAGF